MIGLAVVSFIRAAILSSSSTNHVIRLGFFQFNSIQIILNLNKNSIFSDENVVEKPRPALRLFTENATHLVNNDTDAIYKTGQTIILICEADFPMDWKLPSILETRDYVTPQKIRLNFSDIFKK